MPESKVLFLLDYPTPEDAAGGTIMSGLSQRARVMLRLLKDAKIDQSLISYASAVRCLTRSKSILTYNDYEYCGKAVHNILDSSDIRLVMCFGSIAARLMLGRQAEMIDKYRGHKYPTEDGKRITMVTYSLAILTDQGCSGCGRSVYPHLVNKDLTTLRNEMVKLGII